MSSLLVHAFHSSHSYIASSRLSYFLCFSSLFSLFPTSLFFFFFLLFLFVVVYCAWIRPFYIICHDKIYHFYSLTIFVFLACCGCLSRTAHWSDGYSATTTTLCWPHHALFPDKSSFVFFSCFPWHSHPDKGCVSLLLTPIACT